MEEEGQNPTKLKTFKSVGKVVEDLKTKNNAELGIDSSKNNSSPPATADAKQRFADKLNTLGELVAEEGKEDNAVQLHKSADNIRALAEKDSVTRSN